MKGTQFLSVFYMNGSHILKNTTRKKSNIVAAYSNAFTLYHIQPHHTYIHTEKSVKAL